jgi:hypothetical protein
MRRQGTKPAVKEAAWMVGAMNSRNPVSLPEDKGRTGGLETEDAEVAKTCPDTVVIILSPE